MHATQCDPQVFFFVVVPESVGPMSSQKTITGKIEGVNYKVNHSFLAL